MKIADKILKTLVVLAGIVVVGVQALATFALIHYHKISTLYIVLFGVSAFALLAGVVLYFVWKKHRLAGLLVTAAGAFAVVVIASLLTKEGLEQAVFYRNHLTALVLPALMLVSFLLDRGVRKAAERWREQHLNPKDSVLLHPKDE